MLRAYKYRIYPNEGQKVLFAKTFGCVRVVYNWALETKKKAWEEEKRNMSYYDLQNEMATTLKKEKEWLCEVNAQSLQMSIRNMDTAYTNFFKHGARFPNFKSKHDRQAFHNPQHCSVDFSGSILTIPKAKKVKEVYPDFNLEEEVRNPQFMNYLRNANTEYHASMKQIYEMIHHDEIVEAAKRSAADAYSKSMSQMHNRPHENGLGNQAAVNGQKDLSKLTKKERAELAQRAARGEKITF